MNPFDFPDLDDLVRRWASIADAHPRPSMGSHVRLLGRRITGVVVCRQPLVVRDGRGHEYQTAPFAVRVVQ